MNRATDKANEIISTYKTNDPDKILKKLGVDILDVPLAGRLKEVYFKDHVVLKEGLQQEERRQLLAHAIAHHLLHAGNHLNLKSRTYSFGNYHEKQADVFAAFLLMPEEEIEKLASDNLTIHDLAEKFEVLPYFAKFRIGLAKHYNPKKYQLMWR